MKNIRHWFVLACLASAALVGCVNASTDSQPEVTASASQTTVVRYTADDLEQLAPRAIIEIDLGASDTVYVVEYANPRLLERIVVIDGNDQYLLSDRVTTNVSESSVNRVILSGDPELAAEYLNPASEPASPGDGLGTAEQALPPKGGDLCCTSCTCSGGTCVCTGCVPC